MLYESIESDIGESHTVIIIIIENAAKSYGVRGRAGSIETNNSQIEFYIIM